MMLPCLFLGPYLQAQWGSISALLIVDVGYLLSSFSR